MPHDPVLEATHVVKAEDQVKHDSVLLEKYIAPADGDGGIEFDPHKDYDRWVAARTMALLKTYYAGHFWCVESDCKQHLLKISIPILMGIKNWYVINLKRTELTPGAVLAAGGEILERYRLPRGAFQESSFFEARAKHSALVVQTRPVPE